MLSSDDGSLDYFVEMLHYQILVARVVIGLPGQAHAQVAEAYGCRVGLQMLTDTRRRLRAARVAGDNLNVIRDCASEGRL